MALTAAQRRRLPRSAFAYAPRGAPRSQWRFPIPSKAQARRAGISEGQRQRNLRNAVSRSAQRHTRGTRTQVERVARRRAGATPKNPQRRRRRQPTAWRTSARPSLYTQRRHARYRRTNTRRRRRAR